MRIRLRAGGEYLAHIWEKINAYRVLVGKYEDRRPLGSSTHRQEDSIIMVLKATGLDAMDSINLA
jgi:hypothetical protein